MAGFQFRLAAVLKVREHARDRQRMILAEALAAQSALMRERQQLESVRGLQVNELRQLLNPGEVDVDRAAARRFHASSLTVDMMLMDRRLAGAAEQVAHCRQLLVAADRDVKVLEKLRDQQFQAWTDRQLHIEQVQREEAWQASAGRGDQT